LQFQSSLRLSAAQATALHERSNKSSIINLQFKAPNQRK
jgi:hypothetical protein